MPIRWSELGECYQFDTGEMLGTINPFGPYHGLSGLAHRSDPVNLVKPGASFLNAEYYIRPGAGRRMLPRRISGERKTTHELISDSVVVRFPREPQYDLELRLTYTMQADVIDMGITINPAKDVLGFEIFFASYVCEALDETWVPLLDDDGARQWTKLCNRGTQNSIFGVMRDASMLGHLPAEYPDYPVEVERRPYAEPILVARDSTLGLCLVFMCDPGITKYLAGQYHGWDTAHDWSFGADLVAGRACNARARLVCRRFTAAERMCEQVDRLWGEFKAKE